MAEIDIVSKHLIQTYPADFARFALQRDDIEDVEVIESEQPTVKARRTDRPPPRAHRRRGRLSTS